MLTIFEYIKTQLVWLMAMSWHLTRYMGVGGKWVIMALRLIIYGMLVTPAFAPHILWYMGSSTVIRRVRYRSSRKVKLEIVKALLQWKEATNDQREANAENFPEDQDKQQEPATNKKKVEDWIERSFDDKEKNRGSPAGGKKATDDKARQERKSAMVELLSDKHKEQQQRENSQSPSQSPSTTRPKTDSSDAANAAVLMRSIRAKLSFTDTILSKEQDDEFENKYVTTTVNKTATKYIPVPEGTTLEHVKRDAEKALSSDAEKLGASPLSYFGDSRISRVFNNDDEDGQLLASVNVKRNASGAVPPISPPLSTRGVSPAKLPQGRSPSTSSQQPNTTNAAGTDIPMNNESNQKPSFEAKNAASDAAHLLDDSEQDSLLFNYFQIFCEAYYKKKQALKQQQNKPKSILKKVTGGDDSANVSISTTAKPSIPSTIETLESCDRQATEIARDSLAHQSADSNSKDHSNDTSDPANRTFTNTPQKEQTAISRNATSTESNTQANNLEGGELSAATTPTKIPPSLEKPEGEALVANSPGAESEVDFESEAQVLDAFLEWVEDQCDTEDVRVHNRATLDVFVPIPLHDLLALRSSKFKQSSTVNLAKEVAITATEQKENLLKDGDSGAKPSTDANGAPTLPPSQLRALMKGEAKPFKVCIIVSGGAWIIGCYLWSAILARFFAAAGYVVFVPDYRNFPQAAISGMVEDVTDAIVWVLKNAEIYHGDLNSVTVIGHSAGAHLSLLTILEQCRACQAQEEAQKRAQEVAPVEEQQQQKQPLPPAPLESPASVTSDQLGETANTRSRRKVMANMRALHEGSNTESMFGQPNVPTPVDGQSEGASWSPSGEENATTGSYDTDLSKIPLNQTMSFANKTMLDVFNELKHELQHNGTATVSPTTTVNARKDNTSSPSVTPRNGVSPKNSNVVSFAQGATESPSLVSATFPAVSSTYSGVMRPPLPTSFHSNTKPRFNPKKSITQWIGVSGIYDLPSLEGHFNKRGLYSKVLYALAGYWGDPSDESNRSTAIKDGAEVQRKKDKIQQDQDKEQVKAMAASGMVGQPLSKRSVKQSPLSQTASTVFPPGELDDNTQTPTMGGQRQLEDGFETPLKALRRVSPWWLFVKESPIRSPVFLGHIDSKRDKNSADSLDMMSTHALFSPNSPSNNTVSPSSMSALTTLVPDSSLIPYLPRTLKFLHGTEDDSAPMEESAAMVKVISEAAIEYGNEISDKAQNEKKEGKADEKENEQPLTKLLPSIHNVVFLRASHTDPILEEVLCGKCTVLDIAEKAHVGVKTRHPRRREERAEEKEVEKVANNFTGKNVLHWLHAVLLVIYAWSLEAFSFIFGDHRPHLHSKPVEVKHQPVTFTPPGEKSLNSPTAPYDDRASSPISGLAASPGVPSYYETALAVDKDNMPRLIRWARKICPF